MDSIKDVAWFYSTLAQVSAAIVGLVGAVLGSRIIDHYAMMRGERDELDMRIEGVYREIREALRGEHAFTSTQESQQLFDQLRPNFAANRPAITEADLTAYISQMEMQQGNLSSHHQAIIVRTIQALRLLTSRVSLFHGKFLPGSFFIVIPLLLFIALTGILWPLDALPGMPSHPKQWMLRALFVGLVGLILYLGYLWWSLGRLYRLHWPQ